MSQDAQADAQARLERAEQMLDQARDRGARLLARGLGRAREELEDIWAEAKSMSPPGRR